MAQKGNYDETGSDHGEVLLMKGVPHIFCVLCECKNAGNMGAVARAIKNMDLEGLILVRPNRERWLEAVKMAPGAEDVLECAEMYPSLRDAVRDMHLVIGFTRRIRKHRSSGITPEDAVAEALKLPEGHRIALVFGSERAGLSNEELSLCQRIVHIPCSQELPSINLAQAVMIMAYEWRKACLRKEGLTPEVKKGLAPVDKRERLMDHLEQVLLGIGFYTGHADHIRHTLIDILSRLDLTEREVSILRGILSRIEYALRGKGG